MEIRTQLALDEATFNVHTFGSKTEVSALPRDFRYAPINGHRKAR
jgi:hypothetical protein